MVSGPTLTEDTALTHQRKAQLGAQMEENTETKASESKADVMLHNKALL